MKICPACAAEYPPERSHCERDGVLLVALTTGGSSRPEELIGQTVDGRYLVEKVIGKGGMGTVYACRHVIVGRPFAMKVLRAGVEQTEGVLQRFIREAQTANSIGSRHIVEMNDFGQLPTGQFYVTMELLVGMDLSKALKKGLVRDHLFHVFTQVAEVLELTHQRGVVHRDLKPDNVFLVREGDDPFFVKLLDFGIAKALHAGPSGLTETGMVLGTPYYMSPEQARGEEVDHRTDIYSLGVIMYRAFTGKLPFVADSAVGVLTQHITEMPAPPSRFAGVDAATEQVILRCMEKKRERRFQSMQEVASALIAVRSQVYAPAPPSVHQGSGPASFAYAAQSGAHIAPPVPSGAYAAQSGAHIAPPVPSGAYAAQSGAHIAPPVPSGAYAAQSGAHIAPPVPSGAHAAQSGAHIAPPVPSGAYVAQSGAHIAPPVPSGAYVAQSGAHVATAPGQSGTFGAPSRGVHIGGPDVYTDHAGAHAPTVPIRPGDAPALALPEHTAAHGLAASTAVRVPSQRRKWPIFVGGAAMLALGGGIALTLSAMLTRPDAGGGSSAQGASTQAASAAPTPEPSAAGSTTGAPTATATPSAEPSASTAASGTSAAPSAAPKTTKGGGRTPPTGTSTSKRTPEIRSPFD